MKRANSRPRAKHADRQRAGGQWKPVKDNRVDIHAATSMDNSLTVPIIDAHGHTLDLAFKSGRKLHQGLGGLTDVPLMCAGGVTAQLTACWVPDARIGGPHGSRHPLQEVLRIIDYLHRQLEGEAGGIRSVGPLLPITSKRRIKAGKSPLFWAWRAAMRSRAT